MLVAAMSNDHIPAPVEGSSSFAALESLRVKQLEEQTSALRTSVICAFNQLLDLKDLNTGVHSTRLAEWGMRVDRNWAWKKPNFRISKLPRSCMTSVK